MAAAAGGRCSLRNKIKYIEPVSFDEAPSVDEQIGLDAAVRDFNPSGLIASLGYNTDAQSIMANVALRYFILLVDDANFFEYQQYLAFFKKMQSNPSLLKEFLLHFKIDIPIERFDETSARAIIDVAGHGEEEADANSVFNNIITNYALWFESNPREVERLREYLKNVSATFAIGQLGPSAPMDDGVDFLEDVVCPRLQVWKDRGFTTSQMELALKFLINKAFKDSLTGSATVPLVELLNIVMRHALRVNYYLMWRFTKCEALLPGISSGMKKGDVWKKFYMTESTKDRVLFLSPNDAAEEETYKSEPGCYPLFMCDEHGNQFNVNIGDKFVPLIEDVISPDLNADFRRNNLKINQLPTRLVSIPGMPQRFEDFAFHRLMQLRITGSNLTLARTTIHRALTKIQESTLMGRGARKAVYYSDLIIPFFILNIPLEKYDGLCRPLIMPDGKSAPLRKAAQFDGKYLQEGTQDTTLLNFTGFTGDMEYGGGSRKKMLKKSKNRTVNKKNKKRNSRKITRKNKRRIKTKPSNKVFV